MPKASKTSQRVTKNGRVCGPITVNGVTYAGVRAAERATGIMRNVITRERRKNGNDLIISKEPNAIIVNGVQYPSIVKAASATGFSKEAICKARRVSENGSSLPEATLEPKSRGFTDNGIFYPTLNAYLKQFGVSRYGLRMALARGTPLADLKPAVAPVDVFFEGQLYHGRKTWARAMVAAKRTNATIDALYQRLKHATTEQGWPLTDEQIRELLSWDLQKNGYGYSYCITCKITGLQYFGVTKKHWETRKKEHQNDIHNPKKNTILVQSLRQYGWEQHAFEKLGEHPILELGAVEKELIANHDSLHPNGLNMKRGGNAVRFRREKIIYQGVAYDSLEDVATAHGLTGPVLRDRLARHPDLEYCLSAQFSHTRYAHLHYQGRDYLGYPALAKAFNLPLAGLKERTYAHLLQGVSLQEAVAKAMTIELEAAAIREHGMDCVVCHAHFYPRAVNCRYCSPECSQIQSNQMERERRLVLAGTIL